MINHAFHIDLGDVRAYVRHRAIDGKPFTDISVEIRQEHYGSRQAGWVWGDIVQTHVADVQNRAGGAS